MNWLPRFIQDYRKDPLRFQTELERSGKVFFSARLFTQRFVFLSDPAHIQHMLQSNGKNYKKDFVAMRLTVLLGKGLLTSEGEHWKKQRKLMSPAFHAEHLEVYSEAVRDCTHALEAEWGRRIAKGETEIDIHREMMNLTLQIAGRAFFGSDLTKHLADLWEPLEWVIEEFADRMNQQLVNFPLWIPTPSNRRLKAEIEKLDRVIESIIADARADRSGDRKHLLAVLIAQTEAEKMTTKELRDEILTLFLAGHETTASILAWSFYQLSRNPETAESLRREVAETSGGRSLAYGDLASLDETRKILMETMRLYPPGWMLSRQAIADDEIGGHKVHRGAIVIANAFAVQRSARFWENPDQFDPSRFAAEAGKERPKFAYFPFGGGSRICIGSSFAMMESALVLAHLASRFEMKPVKSEEIRPITRVTLRPEGGIPLSVISLEPFSCADGGRSAEG